MSADGRPDDRGTPQGGHAAFRALLDAAATDPEAARGLVDAYDRLPLPVRSDLVRAVLEDASGDEALGTSLLLLLSIEADPELAQSMAATLFAEGHRDTQARTPRALRGVGPHTEALFLVRPLHGRFVETAALSWSTEGRLESARVEPLCRDDQAERGLAALPDGLSYERLTYEEARDGLGRALWTHRRRHGAWPPAARSVAAFLCG